MFNYNHTIFVMCLYQHAFIYKTKTIGNRQRATNTHSQDFYAMHRFLFGKSGINPDIRAIEKSICHILLKLMIYSLFG